MNWLGAGARSLLAALLGATLGALVHFFLLRLGIDFPPIVALFAGLSAALASTVRSALRGALVASIAVWFAAFAEIVARPIAKHRFVDIVHFHDRLGPWGVFAYVACAILGAILGMRARSTVYSSPAPR